MFQGSGLWFREVGSGSGKWVMVHESELWFREVGSGLWFREVDIGSGK